MKTSLKRKINFLSVALALFTAAPSNAQIIVAGPDTSICLGSSVTLTATVLSGLGTTAVCSPPNLNDDQWSASLPIPFPFTFYGNVFNSCKVGSNNVLSFDPANTCGYCTWPIGTSIPAATPPDMRNCIMGPWQDLYPPQAPPNNGTISYGTAGVAPNRVFVVEWCHIAYFGCFTTLNTTNYILLYEGTNVIENHILLKPFCATWNGGKAAQGLVNATNTLVNITPGRNCTQWAVAVPEARRWTPPSPYIETTIPYGPPILANATVNWFANGNPVGTGLSITVSPTVTTNYIAQVTSICGNITYQDTATVTIVPAFTNTISISDVLCYGDSTGSITVTPTGGTPPFTYLWSTTPPQTTATASNLPAGTYTVTITDAGGCIVTATAVVNQPPDLIVTPNAPTNVTCNGLNDGSASVGVAGGVTPYQYLWTTTPPQTTATASGLTANIYTVTVTDANGCTETVSITVTEPPVLTIAPTTSQTICIGTTVNLMSNAAGGTPPYTYLWSNGDVTPNSTVNPIFTTPYTVLVTDANGCSISSQTILITVLPPLQVSASTSNLSVCNGTSVLISANNISGGDGNYSYQWTPSIGNTAGPISVTPSVTTTYTITLTDGCGTPAATASVTVTVNPMPNVLFSGTPLSGCVPLNVQFTDQSSVSSGTITLRSWDFGDLSSSSSDSMPLHSYVYPSSPLKYSVTLTVTTNAGCSQSFTIPDYVDAHPITIAAFSAAPKITTLADAEITFTDLSYGPTIWTWTFGDSYSDTVQNPLHTYKDTGRFQVCLITSNLYACNDTACDSVTVRPDFTFYVPNAFTPNGDFINEFFTPMGQSFQDYDLNIYDRWGQVIFRSKNIAFSWDGKLSSGKEAMPGIYVYTITLRDMQNVKHSFIGNVALIR